MAKRNNANLAEIERRQNLATEMRAKAKAEENALVERLDETARLADQRGEELDRPKHGRGEGRKPMRRMSGLEWLHRKGKITADQMACGVRYGAAYRRAAAEQSIRSILNRDISGSEGPTVEQLCENATKVAHARQRLAMFRCQLMGEVTIINAVDAVCGLEQTPREAAQNGRDASAIEALVVAGLGLLLIHLAPVPRDFGEPAPDIDMAA